MDKYEILRYVLILLAAAFFLLAILSLYKRISNKALPINIKFRDINITTESSIGISLFSLVSIAYPLYISPTSPAMSACEAFKGRYESILPYIVIDSKTNPVSKYESDIRVTAYEGSWDTRNSECRKEGSIVKLAGIEKTEHRIEMKIDQSEFKYVADGLAIYQSEVIFDENGRMTLRYLISGDMQSIQKSKHEDIDLEKLTYHGHNSLIINPAIGIDNELDKEDYKKRINAYVEKRKAIHKDLKQKACHPLVDIASQRTTIAFLCSSHIRVMRRDTATSALPIMHY